MQYILLKYLFHNLKDSISEDFYLQQYALT